MAPGSHRLFGPDHSTRQTLREKSRVGDVSRTCLRRPGRGAEAFGELAMGYRVAVVGATGNVGREMLNILAERAFPADEVVALASRRSLGTEVSFGDKTLKTKTLDTLDFSDTDIALMSAGCEVSKEWSPKI